MEPFIKKLHIVNYKSIADLTIENIGPFAVFAGANGSGKSTIFEALEFVNHVARFGIKEALRLHGGWANIHNFRLDEDKNKTFEFEIVVKSEAAVHSALNGVATNHYPEIRYTLKVENLHQDSPTIFETHWQDNKLSAENRNGNLNLIFQDITFESVGLQQHYVRVNNSLSITIENLVYYSFNPEAARQLTREQFDNSLLDKQGRNLAAVLSRLESDSSISDSIIELMQLFVPSLESVKTETNSLDGRSGLQFIEEGLSRPFPPHLISDGTLHALNILVALFQRKNSIPLMGTNWTLIEEPERGLHPYAVQELTSIIREAATSLNANSVGVEKFQPFWLTTHSATLVRACRPGELWFVEKTNGFTTVRKADPHPQSRLPLDEAWLSNALDGGLPW